MSSVAAVTIRPYEDDDLEACRACVVELQDAERQIDARLRAGDSMADAYLLRMHARCREYDGAILVAEQGGVGVGLVMVLARVPFESLDEPPGNCAWVAELVVRAGFRGQGIGRALLQAAESYARDAGATELRIAVLSGNRPARELYLDEAFEPYSEVLTKSLTLSARDAAYAEQRRRVEELAAACAIDEQMLLRDLREREIHVTSVWDFIASGGAPPRAVPILVAHLSLDHHERIWEGIVRALAVKHARAAALNVLTELYRRDESRSRRTALAHAIGAMAGLEEVQDLPEIESYRSSFR